jgi:CRP-like cAMP-binding protein
VPNSTSIGQNKLLNGLAAADLTRLQPNFRKVCLTRGRILHPLGARIEHVYFPESGMVSLLSVTTTGQQIETAIIGSEGAVGVRVAIHAAFDNTQSTVQADGSAWQITTAKFLELYRENDPFRSAINRQLGLILFQAQQSATCHAMHSVKARLCRWLLLSQDMLGLEQVPLTQEFLSYMLGVRRTSVSLCAHALQKSGLIQYSRGRIKIQNRKGLEECTCECYAAIREQIDNLSSRF